MAASLIGGPVCFVPMHPRHDPDHDADDRDNPPSRVSDETLDRLYDLASPTRVSIYDRPWFLGLLIFVACSGIAGYVLFLWLR